MVWKEPQFHTCDVVFNMDAYLLPSMKNPSVWNDLRAMIQQSKHGLMQLRHLFSKGPMMELDRIESFMKDTAENVLATKIWLLAQPDFKEVVTFEAENKEFLAMTPRIFSSNRHQNIFLGRALEGSAILARSTFVWVYSTSLWY